MSTWCKRLRRWCKRRSRWNPRTRDPPPSTGKNPETRTYNQTCFPTTESNAPLIDLTHAFDTKVTKVMKKLLVKRKQCRVCGWEGTSEDFCLSHGKAKREELQEQASRCISCRTRLLIMEEITRLEGLVPEATDTLETHVLGSRVDFMWLLPRGLECETRCYDIFMPSEASHSNFDEISTFSRRTISWDATMKDSLKQSIQWARGHITECANQHDQCDIRNGINLDGSTGGTSVNPSRLIDVSPDGMPGLDVKLRDHTSLPSGKPLEYAALSYSWGTYKPDCMTTDATIEKNLDCMPWESLPSTFQDAVEITRGLGLKYLWIDSVCIIQGNTKDWSQEAGKMFDVYKGAKVTLAALFGYNSTSGLRDSTINEQSKILAHLQMGQQSTCPIFIRRHHYLSHNYGQTPHHSEGNLIAPLLTRAWTYQERIVSPRVLFFTEGEVVYHCAATVACECGSASFTWERSIWNVAEKTSIFGAIFDVLRPETSSHIEEESQSSSNDKRLSVVQSRWRRIIVEEFVRLDVTNPRDRLPALGAIAEMFQLARPTSRYLAGLWSDSLIDDLTWTPYHEKRPSSHRKRATRPFDLPTWTWASLQSDIIYMPPYSERTYLAEIVEATCEYAKDNPFGILERSKLVLRSKMLPLTLKNDRELCEPGFLDGQTWQWLRDCEPDDHPDEPQGQDVHLLQLVKEGFSTPDADSVTIYCLVLHAEDHKARVYTRFGILSIDFDMLRVQEEKEGRLYRAFEERGEVVECEIR
ncbi:heterokaryon incompatibility protein-domain-containing protein [Phyllosticta capitalensis]|uniref:heterokaryon incompatibility protein-domain-containing protein n=1 Tax=Phyllosticta capitalensis TaxID=121624 RepID=UPI0031303AC5